MPFTIGAWYESVDPAGAYHALATAADEQSLTTPTPHIIVPTLPMIALAAGGAETTVEPILRLESPTLRIGSRPYVMPLSGAAAGPVLVTSPFPIMDRRSNPLACTAGEQLDAWLLSNPAAAQIQWGVVWFADGPIAPLGSGAAILSMRWHAATALVAGHWVNVIPVFDDVLPVGKYNVVGMRAHSATGIAARLSFQGTGWRPGCLMSTGPTIVGSDIFRSGNLGIWGEFDEANPPTIDFLAEAADAAESGLLDLVKIG